MQNLHIHLNCSGLICIIVSDAPLNSGYFFYILSSGHAHSTPPPSSFIAKLFPLNLSPFLNAAKVHTYNIPYGWLYNSIRAMVCTVVKCWRKFWINSEGERQRLIFFIRRFLLCLAGERETSAGSYGLFLILLYVEQKWSIKRHHNWFHLCIEWRAAKGGLRQSVPLFMQHLKKKFFPPFFFFFNVAFFFLFTTQFAHTIFNYI